MKRLLLVPLFLFCAVAVADDSDQEVARQLKESGDIVSLESLLADVRVRHAGRVLEVELEFEHERYVYEIEMVDDAGEVQEFYYDARDGSFLEQFDSEADEGRKQ